MALAQRAFSRRTLTRALGAGAATAAARSWWLSAPLAAATAPALAPVRTVAPVRLSSNENPYGPPPSAFEAMSEAFAAAWRYPDEREDALVEALAAVHGVGRDQLLLGNGSSQILDLAAAAFTGPAAPVVVAEPTFEAIARYAARRGAPVERVPLTEAWEHDAEGMIAAARRGGGLAYICNPNNPTATLTSTAGLRAILAGVPASTVVLVDEAYHHYADGRPGYRSVADWIGEHPNLVVARTFSKIYGMAGLRCGYALGRPEALAKMREHRPWDSLNLMALAAAKAALQDREHVAQSRRANDEVRADTVRALEGAGRKCLPSSANFLMADLGRDVGPVIAALAERGIEIGRRFPALPSHLRVTIGRAEEMNAFLAALSRVMGA